MAMTAAQAKLAVQFLEASVKEMESVNAALLAACKAVQAAQASGTYQEAFDAVDAAIKKTTT